MERPLIKRLRCRQLHHRAEVHDRNPVGDMLDHRKVMGNEQIGHAPFLLQTHQQIDNLRLYGYIQGGNRLVAHDEFRIDRKGACDSDALALSSGELMRKAAGVLPVKSHHFQKLVDPLGSLLPAATEPVDVQSLGNDVRHRHARVQRCIRILKNNLRPAAEFPLLCPVQAVYVHPVKENLSACLIVQAHGGSPAGGLAAAGFADHAKRLSPVYGEGHIVHRLHRTAGGRKIFTQMIDLQKGCSGICHSAASFCPYKGASTCGARASCSQQEAL